MRVLVFLCAALGLSLLSAFHTPAHGRSVAITVDDLPYAGGALVGGNASEAFSEAEIVNRKLLAAFEAHHVPATGFVIQKRVDALGTESGPRILKEWIRGGFDLGNH